MEELKEIILKAKALKQRRQYKEAIRVLNEGHEVGVKNNAVEDLIDIHNQLILLYYQDNDPAMFQKSYNFSRTLAVKVGYNSGLVEAFMNKAWVETDNKNFMDAIIHASEALAIDEILENASAFTTALYIISEANYKVGDIEKGDKYKQLYQKKLMRLTDSEEEMLRSIEGLSVGMTKEEDLDTRVMQALEELDSF